MNSQNELCAIRHLHTRIPDGADDISIRVPRPKFELPGLGVRPEGAGEP